MNEALKTAALAYATALVEFYEMEEHCKTSTLQQDHSALRNARNALYTAQDALDTLARCSV